ncbi:MAG: hypothetical protein ACRESX_08955 [Gammaproteobacteria bacterium]
MRFGMAGQHTQGTAAGGGVWGRVSFRPFSLRVQRKWTRRAGAGEPHAANDVPLQRHGWAATAFNFFDK